MNRVTALTLTALTIALAKPAAGKSNPVRAVDFGVVADGFTDDGAAIGRLLHATTLAASPVHIVFPEKRTIRITTAHKRYVFDLEGLTDVTIDGGGSTFLLGPDVRFLRLRECTRFVLRNAVIDYAPLPFVDGAVTAVDPKRGSVDVRIDTNESAPANAPSGGPTRQDGEQRFFAMLWHPGTYGPISDHLWLRDMVPIPGSGGGRATTSVRCLAGDDFRRFAAIKPGTSHISLPIPGIALRYGPGACLEIRDTDSALFEDVELWSAPWFGFLVLRNRGEVTFRRVNIRPKPGSGRRMSVWRDGFHVKGNSARLLWEDCILSGMNDDAFNLSNHSSRVRKVESPTRIEVIQIYPLNIMPWHEGEELLVADVESRTLLGGARITGVTHSDKERWIHGTPAATPVTLDLSQPIPDLRPGAMAWEPAYANPDTTLRRCQIEQSCRLQVPVTLDACHVTAFLWFYGEHNEGPFPSRITIRDCALRRGRGNPDLALSFLGRAREGAGPSVIHDVVIQNSDIWGRVNLTGLDRVTLQGNCFPEKGARIMMRDNRFITQSGNTGANGNPLEIRNR